MTLLYRCSGGHHLSTPSRESFKFLSNVSERAAIASHLSLPNPIIDVFNRGPIPYQYQTRFGPPNYLRNPLYAASDIDTTFYEYGFHLLASNALDGVEIKITCFDLDCHLSGNISAPSQDHNAAEILTPTTNYSASHAWLLGQSPSPDIVRYPSVRHPSGNPPQTGENFAIYSRASILQVANQVQLLLKLNKSQNTFTVYDTLSDWMVELAPKG